MLDDEEKAGGVQEERGELDGGTTTGTWEGPGDRPQGSGAALPPPGDYCSPQQLLGDLQEVLLPSLLDT